MELPNTEDEDKTLKGQAKKATSMKESDRMIADSSSAQTQANSHIVSPKTWEETAVSRAVSQQRGLARMKGK